MQPTESLSPSEDSSVLADGAIPRRFERSWQPLLYGHGVLGLPAPL